MSQLHTRGFAGAARALAALAAVVWIAACGASVPPSAVLTAPTANALLEVDKQADIVGKVIGSGVKAADIYVDGIKYATINMPSSPDTFDIVAPWTPSMPGAHVIQLKGVNDKGEVLIASELVFVTVEAPPPTPAPPAPTPEPTATPEPAPTAAPTVAAPADVTGTAGTTATTTTTDTVAAAPTAAPAGGPQITIANEYANIRTGPGTSYERLGQLNQNQTAPVTGKSEDGAWWQISYPSGPDGKAWVFGELVQFTGDAAQVPVVKVAPPPTAPAQPTAPPQPTAAPTSDLPASAQLPYSQNMRFEPRDDIGDVPLGYNESKSSSLAWTVNGAKQLDLEITTTQGPGIFSDCPAGNLGSIAAAGFTPGQRVPLSVPSGRFPFTINDKGYYLFTIHVVKADGSTTTIPRNVIVDCFKK